MGKGKRVKRLLPGQREPGVRKIELKREKKGKGRVSVGNMDGVCSNPKKTKKAGKNTERSMK